MMNHHMKNVGIIMGVALMLFSISNCETPAICSVVQGLPGLNGRDGRDGTNGLKGDPGIRGEPGIPGERGSIGPPGKVGPVGNQGDKGNKGDAGIRGEPGTPGEKGSVGPQGKEGLKGNPGPNGNNGVAGPHGSQGEKGSKGDSGNGLPGLKGSKGENGSPGPSGSKGEKGFKGDSGIGLQGLKGSKGENGSPDDSTKERLKVFEKQLLTFEAKLNKYNKILLFQGIQQSGDKLFITNGLEESFENGQNICRKFGGDLATPRNLAENKAVQNIIVMKGETSKAILGITDLNLEGTFKYSSGELITFRNWNQGEPNNYNGKEDCVDIWYNGRWNDIPCDEKRLVICEFK